MSSFSSAAFPNTNNALLPSLDRQLRTENYLPGSGSPMNADGETILRLRLNDGATPHTVTIPVDGVPTTASDWKLIPHPTLPGQFRWVPL